MTTTNEAAKRTGAAQGDLWSEHSETWAELMEPCMRPLTDAALDALGVGAGTNLLDVGCGSGGLLTVAAARGGHVTGLDAALGMVTVARRRLPNARIEHGDIEELPFSDESFDAVTGTNAFQYAATPREALVEARRVLRPSGRLVAAVWSPPELCGLAPYLAALGAQLPPPVPGAPGPFALSDDGALTQLLASAGLHPIETRDVVCQFDWRDDRTALDALLSAGPAVRAVRHAGLAAVERAVRESIAPFRTSAGGYAIENAFRYAIAGR
jgi:SAM-dependent methyltransferase